MVRAPAYSLEMLENSWQRKARSVGARVVVTRRLTSSRSTDAGWCFVACLMPQVLTSRVAIRDDVQQVCS